MGLLKWLFEGFGHDVAELARRLGVDRQELRRLEPRYYRFTIPKRSGGRRQILAPEPDLKRMQRRILRRLLGRLAAHPAATGFERGRSIVSNARRHQRQAVVLSLDLKDFFPSTTEKRVKRYFRRIGWNRRAASLLVRLCCHEGGLPQGAPTSPRLSNLVNYRLDARIAGMAALLGGVYTRYADDMTISFPERQPDETPCLEELWRSPCTGLTIDVTPGEPTSGTVLYMQHFVFRAAAEEGYRVHHRRKLTVRRRHHRQTVTGLVVNDRVNLPRSTRRWLRAVEHRTRLAQSGQPMTSQPPGSPFPKRPTLTPAQLEGWRALRAMIDRQRTSQPRSGDSQ